MVQRGERLRLALESREAFRIAGEQVRQDFDRDIAIEVRVSGPIDFAPATRADGRLDDVRTEAGAGRQRHCEVSDYSSGVREFAARATCARGLPTEVPLPHRIAENHDWRGRRRVFSGEKDPPQRRSGTKHLKDHG